MARVFNGTSDFIIGSTPASYTTGPTSFTLASWCYSTGSGTNTDSDILVLGTQADTASAGQVRLRVNTVSTNKQVQADARANGDSTVNTSAVYINNQWFHTAAVFVFDSSFVVTNMAIYLNGANKVTSTPSRSFTGRSISGFTIATLKMGAGPDLNHFTGRLMDAAFWTATLSDAQIALLAAGTRPINVGTAPAGWWPLDGFASPEPDLSGNGNNGTLTGTTVALGAPAVSRAMGS